MDYNQKEKLSKNTEIVNELTKNLQSSVIEVKDEKTALDNCTENDETNEKYHSNVKNENEIINEEEKDEYFVDDIILKDRDFTLSDEEKQVSIQ
jgi:hypothetical protein